MVEYKQTPESIKLREMIADVDCDDEELNIKLLCLREPIFEYRKINGKHYYKHKSDTQYFKYADHFSDHTKSLDAIYECIPDGYMVDIGCYSKDNSYKARFYYKRNAHSAVVGKKLPTIHRALMDALVQCIDYNRFMEGCDARISSTL